MSEAFSSKALPPGTILREWRLEQVLGVSGFGFLYKARGIYFDEIVAIKEYFPGAISDRRENNDAVIPADSALEAAHEQGLRKFVEEARLLWHLSMPTHHPSIVNVRSLFEINGTAYLVMDFEEGKPLSRLLLGGARFDEAKLLGLLRPIAEGLERAHRVGVLHRAIAPAGILVNGRGRPVLVDFGSARVDQGEMAEGGFPATPYAAIELYDRSREQGAWTDIYALGAVLRECITGEAPPPAPEREGAAAASPLAEGRWPGYSRPFLAAVDSAMAIDPSARPQSISQWLTMFDRFDDGPSPLAEREPAAPAPIAAPIARPQSRAPVAEDKPEAPASPVQPPADSAAQAPDDAPARPKPKKRMALDPLAVPPSATAGMEPAAEPPIEAKAPEAAPPKAAPAEAPQALETTPAVKDAGPAKPGAATKGRKPKPAMIGGAALALALAVGGGWYASRSLPTGKPDEALAVAETPVEEAIVPVEIDLSGGVAEAVRALLEDARSAGAPAGAMAYLADAEAQLAPLDAEWRQLAADPAQAEAAQAKDSEMGAIARSAAARFANALIADADGRTRRLAADLPWADPRKANASAGQSAERRNAARDIRITLSGIRSAAASAQTTEDPTEALGFARQALAKNASYNASINRAYRARDSRPSTAASAAIAPVATPIPLLPTPTAAAAPPPSAEPAAPARSEPATSAQKRQLKSVVDDGKDIAKQVIRLGERNKPGSNATDEEKEGYSLRQANADAARDYRKYLDTLSNSMRGARTSDEADQLIRQANQTRTYLSQLLARSKAAQ